MQLRNLVQSTIGLVMLLLAARQGCHCINLYCLKGEFKREFISIDYKIGHALISAFCPSPIQTSGSTEKT
ncbi:hypothetical protein K492DRAFT_178024 [Lichtheimia hyalospora FSU 10163]|nr:hypothetical protein K492DRAFT_178024 [Lichtheimia hyalospora FSU 10163]